MYKCKNSKYWHQLGHVHGIRLDKLREDVGRPHILLSDDSYFELIFYGKFNRVLEKFPKLGNPFDRLITKSD